MSYIFIPTVTTVENVQEVTPTTGSTVSVNANTNMLILNPAGLLLSLTITLPQGTDGQYLRIATRQAITTLTVNGASIIGSLTSLILGGFATYRFNASDNVWDRVG